MPGIPLKTAVFFDRDGTLIHDRGYISDFADLVFYQNTIPALKRLKNEHLLFIITNQEGIGLGRLRYEDVDRLHQQIAETLAKAGVNISAIYFCPHTRDEGCHCIKPKPHFLLKASKEFNIDLTHSFVVGDHPYDMEFAQSVGAKGILVLTGHGYRHISEHRDKQDIFVAKDLDEAVSWILKSRKRISYPSGGREAERKEINKGLIPTRKIMWHNPALPFPSLVRQQGGR